MSVAAAATTAPESALAAGINLLANGDYAQALARFQKAGRAVPSAPEPYFYAGAALNRLGDAQRALVMLDRAGYLYGVTPSVALPAEYGFERGWALLGTGRFAETTAVLTRQEAQHPGHGQTAEFLGRAAVGSGDYAAAERWFDLAEQRDPNLAGTLALARAALAAKRGEANAQRDFAVALARPDNARLSRLLAERVPLTPAQAVADFGVTLGLGAGHNSNALGLGDDQPIASSANAEEDRFQRFLLSAYYRWRPQQWTVQASYSLQADRYADVSTVNQLDNQLGLRVERALTPSLTAAVEVRDRYTRIDNDALLNEVSAQPSLSWRVRDDLTLDFAYDYADGNYLNRPAAPVFDRDHQTHGVSPTVRWALPAINSQLQATYVHRWADAAGADFDADADGATVRFDSNLPWRLSTRAVVFYENRSFDSANTLSATGAARRDGFYYASLYVQRPLGDVPGMSDRLRLYAQYDYADRSSNVPFYSYRQHQFSAGILLAF